MFDILVALRAHLGVVLVLNVRQYRSCYSQTRPIVTYVWTGVEINCIPPHRRAARRQVLPVLAGMSVSLSVCVRLLAMTVSPAKKDDPTQMPFVRQNRVNPGAMH